MPTALQTPIREGKAEKVGPRRYRKQVLPVGHVDHDGKRLDFTPTYLKQLADSFNDGKMDQVPFILVEPDNRHSQDPEKVRGDVEALEVASDGLYAVVSLSERGEQLVRENPKLGVSARIDQEQKVLEHVAATVNPVVKGMKGWEALDLSADENVLDLTDGAFVSDDADSTDEVTTDSLKPEQVKRLAALADRLKDQDVSDRDTLTEDDIAKLLGSDDDTDKETSDDKDPVAVLSKEAQEKIDLAQKDAREARDAARDAADKVAAAEWKNQRRDFAEKGVPPSMLDLAEPHLSKASSVIELSKSDSQASSMLKMLEEAVGTVDLSERGSSNPETEDDEKQAKEAAADEKAWA